MSDSDSMPVGFRAISGFPRYAINEHGTVLSVCVRGGGWRKPIPWTDAKRMTFTKDNNGYHKVALSNSGKEQQVPVHTLVLLTFVGPRPDGMECRHLDGCKTNNHVSNLAWGTSRENHRDQIRHGTRIRGEAHPKSKLTAEDVLEIRRRLANSETLRSLAKEFNLNKSTIGHIAKRRTWTHI